MNWFRLRKELRLRKKVEKPETVKTVQKKEILASSYAYVRRLRKHGFEEIGSGAYSTVLAKPGSDKAIKVCRGLDAWPDYVIWGHQNGYAGRFTPKIYSYKYHEKSEPFYVATMERLKGTMRDLDKTNPLKIVPELALIAERRSANDNVTKSLFDVVIPGFGEFFGCFREKFRSCLDLHGGNWMFREDNSLVLTDPVTSSTTYKTRFKYAA